MIPFRLPYVLYSNPGHGMAGVFFVTKNPAGAGLKYFRLVAGNRSLPCEEATKNPKTHHKDTQKNHALSTTHNMVLTAFGQKYSVAYTGGALLCGV